ncbi:uncharacterized protein LOC131593650 [Vicia villosa]|uniref:uncharacterized protein LOC131593650 n=1 Tax=Vicia villosa TaxID=3911 RepID=UPI00273AD4DC|nr:uncharacterized protein LOC131593650 [Vicia villosa]
MSLRRGSWENSVHSIGSDGRANGQHDKLTPEDLLELCLVGSVLTNKTIRFNVLKDMLAKMWQPGQSMNITKIDENMFLFQFYQHWDQERVLEGCTWLYDNFMLATRKLKFWEDPLAVPLDEVEIWVQIHQLPFGFMDEDFGVLIGNHIGKFIGYDTYNNYPVWRKYMRIKVAINVQLPLKKSWAFDRVEGEKVYLVFKFEKLGTFCFLYGIIGHSEKFCPRKLCSNLSNGANGWGNFLRAESIASGGNGGENKWLRNGRRIKESSLNSQSNEESSNGVVGEHMLYGRVVIDRYPISRKLVFFKNAGMIGKNSNNWTSFSPTDKGDALTANGDCCTPKFSHLILC